MAKFSSTTCDENSRLSNAPFRAQRPTWAEINLDALAANLRQVRACIARNVKVMCVVKANAYGHGATECARRLATEGADWFAVALPEEALALRQAGINQPILSLNGFWSGQEALCLRENIVPVVYQVQMIEALDRVARDAGRTIDVHIKIDTGMNRLGLRRDQINEFADAAQRYNHVRIDGAMTHFAAADDVTSDDFTHEQIRTFKEAVDSLRARGITPTFEDMANSAATFAQGANAHGNMVRPGGILYGLWRDVLPAKIDASASLRAVMSVRSRIALVKRVPQGETLGYGRTFKTSRETLVATLPIGYNDGYPRALSNHGRVIVRGQYAPVIGRVSMDLTLVDVTDVNDVAPDDCVTLLGEDGTYAITAEEIARIAGTISYEITCGINARVPRMYVPKEP
jgi:alanine racemase